MNQRERKGIYFREEMESSKLYIISKVPSGKEAAIVKVTSTIKERLDLHWNKGKGDFTTSPL